MREHEEDFNRKVARLNEERNKNETLKKICAVNKLKSEQKFKEQEEEKEKILKTAMMHMNQVFYFGISTI